MYHHGVPHISIEMWESTNSMELLDPVRDQKNEAFSAVLPEGKRRK
jgi:hypothetical protein